MRLRVAEIDEHAIAHVFRDEAPEAAHRIGDARLIGRNDLAQVLGVETRGERRRTDKVRKHHGDLAALGGVLGRFVGCQRSVAYRRWCARFSAQGGYSVQQLTPMSDKSDAKILQIFRRQTRQDRVVDLIFAEGRLIFFEAEFPQPISDVHGGAPVRLAVHDPPGETACLGHRLLNDRFGSKGEILAVSK